MTVSDLTPDALARLEAKLEADLEMVRRVRALLEEHRGALGQGAGAAPPVVAPAQVPPALVIGGVSPRKSTNERLAAALLEMPPEGFRTDDLRRRARKQGVNPDDALLKTFLNQMLRQGKVRVLQVRKGRGGSTYISTIPKPPVGEGSSISAENGGPSPDSGPAAAVSGQVGSV